jgi:putative tryptophan/tyrosine transport system substrate-binding protein
MKKAAVPSILVAVVSLALGVIAEAQQPKKVAKIGVLLPSTSTATAHLLATFREGLRKHGYVEGKSFVLEARYGDGKAERLPELARELVALKVDVILTSTDGAIAVVKQQTQTIPIVMATSTDPVGTGFVARSSAPPAEMSPALCPRSSVGSAWSC